MVKLQLRAVPRRQDLSRFEQPLPSGIAHHDSQVGFFKGMWRHTHPALLRALRLGVLPVDAAISRQEDAHPAVAC